MCSKTINQSNTPTTLKIQTLKNRGLIKIWFTHKNSSTNQVMKTTPICFQEITIVLSCENRMTHFTYTQFTISYWVIISINGEFN